MGVGVGIIRLKAITVNWYWIGLTETELGNKLLEGILKQLHTIASREDTSGF